MKRVVVVGSGFAGVAAALSARRAGADVTLVAWRSGASVLFSGAYDLAGWNAPGGDRDAIPLEVMTILREVGAPPVFHANMRDPAAATPPLGHGAESHSIRVVSALGVLRTARGRDLQVLAVDDLAGPVLVPRVPVGSWDADAVASMLDVGLRALGRPGARAIDATLVEHIREYRMPLADLAAAHDEPRRASWLVARLVEALERAGGGGALLLPPMLGLEARTIQWLRSELPIAIGESLGEPGGPAAFRFRSWSARALSEAGVRVVHGVAVSSSVAGVEIAPVCADDPSEEAPAAGGLRGELLASDVVVLATGGILGGGLSFGTAEHDYGTELPAGARAAIRLTVRIRDRGVSVWLDGTPMAAAGSLFGEDGGQFLRGEQPSLIRAGLCVDGAFRVVDDDRRPIEWLRATGDLIAGRDRTALVAMASGLRAGTLAAASPPPEERAVDGVAS